MSEPLVPIFQVVAALEALGVAYFIGGSIASIAYGTIRATMDADLVADLRPEHVPAFVQALQDDFYVDASMIADAIKRRSSFNVLHLPTLFKIDVFLPKDRPFDQSQLERRQQQVLDAEGQRPVYLASPEDVVLAKLEWYRLGGHSSERQWGDVIGVLKTKGGGLDLAYLRRWAAELTIDDLLIRALAEAGLTP